jgi:hypothetical protein
LFVWPTIHGRWYPWHPTAWDDLCALPFPGLGRLLVAYAEGAPAAAEAEIERLIDSYPSQRHQALIARTILLARAAAAATYLGRLDQIVAGMPEGEKGFLGQTAQVKAMIGEIAALQRQLDTMDRPAFREPVAGNLTARIDIFKYKSAGFAQPLASEFCEASHRWLKIAQRQHDEVKALLSPTPTPQVFRAGEAVDRDTEAFVPRMPIIEQLEGQIMLATGCPGLLVGGRRRMGKSTLIRNLIGFIPETVKVVAISMQAARALASLAHLCELIGGEIGGAAGPPPLPPSNDPPLVRLFDPRFWGDGGIERIHTEAGGWPHLVQLLAETDAHAVA